MSIGINQSRLTAKFSSPSVHQTLGFTKREGFMDFGLELWHAIRILRAIMGGLIISYCVFIALPRTSIRHFGKISGIVATIAAVATFLGGGYLIIDNCSSDFLGLLSVAGLFILTFFTWLMAGILMARCIGYKGGKQGSDAAKN
jgi:hypothetical protein